MRKIREVFPNLFTATAEKQSTSEQSTSEKTLKNPTEQKRSYPVDMFGNYILPGNYITYPGRKGSSIYMRTAKVLEIEEKDGYYDNKEIIIKIAVAIEPDRIIKTNISQFQRVVSIPQSYIQNDKRYRNLLGY